MKQKNKQYTCNEYRAEMTLLSLELRLNKPEISETERLTIEDEIKKIRADMDME